MTIPGCRARKPGLARLPRYLALACLSLLPALAETPAIPQNPVDPLPQDSGTKGLQEQLLRLRTTARLMQTTAHPDDEDGGLLTLESRGKGAAVLLLTMNRGEGGQNKVGSNLFDVLGVLRTLELTAADKYYGVEQRFTSVADFGFSKSAEETFQKWQGHDVALGDMVRVIRTFRPDVLVTRFSGTERDGHGNHQASAILTKEAFRAAADPNRFPEQLQEGLQPWQAKKLYIGNVCGFGAMTCPAENYTVRLNTGEQSSALGMTYVQFAVNEGLRHQLSQGAGGWSIDAGPHYAYYKLVDSVVPPTTDKEGHEPDFFAGLDTSLPGLVARLGDEQAKAPWLKSMLERIQGRIAEATKAADKNPRSAVAPLLEGCKDTHDLLDKVRNSELPPATKSQLLPSLDTKAREFVEAIRLAAGAELTAVAELPVGVGPEGVAMVAPGQKFEVTARFSAADPAIKGEGITLEMPRGWKQQVISKESSGGGETVRFRVEAPPDAQYTRPYWHRNNPETDGLNLIDVPQDVTLPFPPPPVKVVAVIGKAGVLSAPCMVNYKNADGSANRRTLAVAPPFSIALEPATEVIPTQRDGSTEVRVGVRSNIATVEPASLKLQLPAGWSAEPQIQSVSFGKAGESRDFTFRVHPSDLREGRAQIKAALEYQHKTYDLGYSVVTREDLDTFYYYQPAVQRVSIVQVQAPKDLRVGYVMGAGDDIPQALRQIGMDVTLVPAEKLASEDLSRYGTVVLGIRAYDTQKEIAEQNRKLLDYVSGGGTLVVQYNASVSDFNNGHVTPYPAQLSRARVSLEEAAVQILAPEDAVFHYPNQITARDFDGWVQERGLYFMDQWDAKFKPLLACQDPGEPLQKGGLLQAQYGKGTYIFTGYAFFRQLPAGVPGAVRLYVNLLSAGHERQIGAH